MVKIEFKEKKQFLSLGRNGFVWTDGIFIDEHFKGNAIEISPLTSRGGIGRCWVSIPKEHIQELINELEKLK